MRHNPDLLPGDGVYRNFKPSMYGRILACDSRRVGSNVDPQTFYLVLWKNGSEEWVWYLNVRSISDLIADHEKKAETARSNLAKAQAL